MASPTSSHGGCRLRPFPPVIPWITLFLAACSPDLVNPTREVVEVVVSPDQVGFDAVGDTAQFVAWALDAQGNQMAVQGFTWLSDAVGVADVSGEGLVTSTGNGSAEVTASVSSGVSGSARIIVEQVAISVSTLPDRWETDALGDTARLTARAVDRLGATVPDTPVHWTSSDPSVVAVTPDGLVTSMGNGEAMLTASAGGLEGSVPVTVQQVAMSLVAEPGVPLIQGVGETITLSAALTDRLGHALDFTEVAWTSSDPSVVLVTSEGQATGVSLGFATLLAASGSFETVVPLSVTPVNDWDAVEDWHTHQGGAAHTGHAAVALDPADFQEEWSVVAAGDWPIGPMTVEGDAIVFSTRSFFGIWVVGVLEVSTGSNRWLTVAPEEGQYHDPAIRNGVVYVVFDSWVGAYPSLQGLSAATGSRLFGRTLFEMYPSGRAPLVQDGGVFMFMDRGMYSLSATDGRMLWEMPYDTWGEQVPAVAQGVVYGYDMQDRGVLMVDAAAGTLLGSISDEAAWWLSSTPGTPVITTSGRLAVTGGERLVVFDLGTRSIEWEASAGYQDPVMAVDGLIYVRRWSGSVEAFDEADGTLLWTWAPPEGERLYEGATVATRNLVFLSTDKATYAVHPATGTSVWSIDKPGNLAFSRTGRLIIGSPNGMVTSVRVRGP